MDNQGDGGAGDLLARSSPSTQHPINQPSGEGETSPRCGWRDASCRAPAPLVGPELWCSEQYRQGAGGSLPPFHPPWRAVLCTVKFVVPL